MIARARLWLVGDDEALEALAELSRHLDYFEVSRSDGAPEEALGARDHVVVGSDDPARRASLVREILACGTPGFLSSIPERDRAGAGARAIRVAAQLVDALYAD